MTQLIYGECCLLTMFDSRHQRPVGRRCDLFQAMAASLQTQGNVPESSISNSTSEIDISQPGTSAQGSQSEQQVGNALVLAELRALANRLDRFEAEFDHSQSDTRTSTPRRRKRARMNQGNSLMTNSQQSLNESAIPVTITSAPTVSVAVSRAIDVTAGVTTTTMASATPITTVPLVRPTSNTSPVTGTIGTSNTIVTLHVHTSLVGPPVISYPVTSIPGLALSVGGQTVMTGSQMPTGLPQSTVCTSTLANHQIVSHPQQVQSYSQVLPLSQQVQTDVTRGGGTSMAGTQGLVPTQSTHVNFTGTGMTSMAANPVVPQVTAPYHVSMYVLPVSHALPLQSLQQLPMPMPVPQQPHTDGVQQQAVGLPTLNTLRSSAMDQQLIQERLQQLRERSVPQPQGELIHCCDNNIKKKKKIECTWPQDCAFVGHLRTRLTYEQLNVKQFVLGFLKSIQLESFPSIRANMVEYLTELMQNVCDQGWVHAKGAHSVVMTNMEEGIVSWLEKM